MKFGVKSDRGMVRDLNEDSYNIITGYPGVPDCFIIADGMGGHNAGEIASKMAVDCISRYILESPDVFLDEAKIPQALSEIISKTNDQIYSNSMQHAANSGMGTTLVAAIAAGNTLYVAHIGDSRAYVVRDGKILRITTDHSFIEELIKNGTLTREEAENHPKKNIITRALGCSADVSADIYSFDIHKNDIFIICTDGLSNMLDEEEMKKVAEEEEEPEKACARLVDMANEKGGDDNITVIVFRN